MTKPVKIKILKSIFVTIVLAGICVGAYFLLRHFGLDNAEILRTYVGETGAVGILVFIILQALQVILIPWSATILTIPAIILFDPFTAFWTSWVGICIGSYLMYAIGRYAGIGINKWIVGNEKSNRFSTMLSKGKFMMPIMLLIPVFPDDMLCCCAGIAKIKFWYFLITITITRAIDNFCTCFIGAQMIKSTTGIVFLCIFVAIMIVATILVAKYQDNMDAWIVKHFSSKNKVKADEKNQENKEISPAQENDKDIKNQGIADKTNDDEKKV